MGDEPSVPEKKQVASVREIRPGVRYFGEPPIATSERVAPYCLHASMAVDPIARKIRCRDCRADLDPIDAFRVLAREGDRVLAMRAEIRDLTKQVEALKAERTRLRAAVRRATR